MRRTITIVFLLVVTMTFACVSARKPDVPQGPLTRADLERLAASDDLEAKRDLLPQLVNALLLSNDKEERFLAFQAMQGASDTTVSPLFTMALADPELCQRLVTGLQELWKRECKDMRFAFHLEEDEARRLKYMNGKKSLIIDLINGQSCLDTYEWMWQMCAEYTYGDWTVCKQWAAAHASEEDTERLLRLLNSDLESEERRFYYATVLVERPLTPEQRRRTSQGGHDLRFEGEIIYRLLTEEPRFTDEEIIELLSGEYYCGRNKAAMLPALSAECTNETKWRLILLPHQDPALQAELLKEVYSGWNAEREKFIIEQCPESTFNDFCWNAANLALAHDLAIDVPAFQRILVVNLYRDFHGPGSYLYSEMSARAFAKLPRERRLLINAEYQMHQAEHLVNILDKDYTIHRLESAEEYLAWIRKNDYLASELPKAEEEREQLLVKANEILEEKRDEIRQYVQQAVAYGYSLTDPELQRAFEQFLADKRRANKVIVRPMFEEAKKNLAELKRTYAQEIKNPSYIGWGGSEWW